ncbi:MAG: acyl-ACP thioesterase domain-containing protein [Solirubrobacteraceae bacterium]
MSQLVERPAEGRVFHVDAASGLGDVAPSGRVRLDTIARWMQEAAWADAADSGLADEGAWFVRAMRVEVARFPRFGEACDVATWCSGTGALWAERRTSVAGAGGARAEAAAIWVHMESDGSRPRSLPQGFDHFYAAAAGGRRVRARLRHDPDPADGATKEPWRFRAADLDLAGHVNNAVYWTVVEEQLAGPTDPSEPFAAEIEHRAPTAERDAIVRRAGAQTWVCAGHGAVVATIVVD